MRQEELRLKPLNAQVIVITGATSGIGLATAKMAAAKGARVVLSSRTEQDLIQVLKELREDGGKVIGVVADVSQYDEMENLRDCAVEAFGGIDTWVNNAGTSIYGLLSETPLAQEKQIFETNFWGVRHGCRVAIPALQEKGGVLINLASEVSARAIPLQVMYSATKHAIKAYTDALRIELEKNEIPIGVSLIRTAGIDTPFAEHAMNELPAGSPSLPSPVFHPNVVAEAILSCAVRSRRDVYIGASSRWAAARYVLLPRLLDRLIKKPMFDKQARGWAIPHTRKNEALMHAPVEEGEIRVGHRGYDQSRSWYTQLNLNPWRSIALAGLAGFAAFAVIVAYQGMQTSFPKAKAI